MIKKLSLSLCAAILMTALPCSVWADTPSVSAESAILIEASSGDVIFEKNAREPRPMASTTKIMTALVAIEHVDLAKEVFVSDKAVGVEGSSIYLKSGEQLTMENLVYALMLESANDAAAAIAVEIAGSVDAFAALMNQKAQELGLENTHFTNPHGLDNEAHYTTAYDLAVLTAYALQNETFAKIVSTYKTTIPLYGTEGTRLLLNHNKMLRFYADAIGVKTGFTKKSGRCLVSAAKRDGVTMVAVTLSAPDDWNDHKAMLDYGFTQYECISLADAGTLDYRMPVVGGIAEEVALSNVDGLTICLPRDADVTSVVEMKRFCYAPVKTGDALGRIVYYRDGVEIGFLPLTARYDVPAREKELSFWEKLFQ